MWLKYPDGIVVVYGQAGKKNEFKGTNRIIWQLLDGKRSIYSIVKYICEFYNTSFEAELKNMIFFLNI